MEKPGGPRRDEIVRPPVAKLALDKALALLLLALTLPLTVPIALAIKLEGLFRPETRGSVLRREVRISQGRPFRLLKFRILTPKVIRMQAETGISPKDAENAPGSLTAVGRFLKKFGLDEIPQLVNILRGDMSFVGPRPKPEPEYAAELARGVAHRRLLRAGLTGTVQIMKGTARTYEDELGADHEYLESCRTLSSWSLLLLDLRILGKTIRVVLRGTGE